MGVKINTKDLDLSDINLSNNNNQIIGELRSAAFSPNFNKIVGIAMIQMDFYKNSKNFSININGITIDGEICNLPII